MKALAIVKPRFNINQEKINTSDECFLYFGIPIVAPDPTTMKPHHLEKDGVPKKKLPTKTTRKDRNFVKNLSEYFTDYCNNTSIQGIRYLGETRRSILEKLFWIVALSTSIYLCSGLILQVYRKWQSGPVIVTFSNTLTPVWKVPFPAITICPESKTNRTVYDYQVARKMFSTEPDNMTEEELNHFEQMHSLCGDVFSMHSLSGDALQGGGNKSSGNDTVDFILKVAPTCDWGWTCKWNNTQTSETDEECNKVLTPVLTDDGVCFSFNMLDGEELFTNSVYYPKQLFKHDLKSTNWSLEKGYYSNVMGSDDYPRRTSAGFTLSFSLSIFGKESNLDYGCKGAIHGYKILLHNPAEIPRLSRNMFMVSFDKRITVSMKPDMITTSDELQNYDPQKRQCYYSHEKQLQYYKFYTKSNCDIECLTNYTLKICGCVAFYMPRNHTTATCGRSHIFCIGTAEKIMFLEEMKLDVMNENGTEVRCNCLSSCTSLTYTTATSEVDYKWQTLMLEDDEYLNSSEAYSFTQIYFFFNDPYFITIERKELYGVTEFIANCGGFLGLFMGCSFISVVEIIYFLTVRLIINVRNYGYNFWSGPSRVGIANEISRKTFKRPHKKCIARENKVTVVDLEG